MKVVYLLKITGFPWLKVECRISQSKVQHSTDRVSHLVVECLPWFGMFIVTNYIGRNCNYCTSLCLDMAVWRQYRMGSVFSCRARLPQSHALWIWQNQSENSHHSLGKYPFDWLTVSFFITCP